LALILSAFINKGIRNVIMQLEGMIDDILHGSLHARVSPDSVAVDFQKVVIHTNTLLDTFVKQIEEQRKLEDQIHGSQRLEAIGTLAGGIAHDFNNILTSMHAYAQIVKVNVPKNSIAEQNMNELIVSIRRASELIEQILTFSRQVKTEDVYIDISNEIKESIKLFKAALPRNIQVEQDLSPERFLIKANPSQIHQVFMNLYTNAYQAMRRTGGILTVATEKVVIQKKDALNLNEGIYCKISIEDTGHGMEREIQKRIFEPFFTTKPVGEGTGMGLSVVHGILRRYGGTIEVESAPGKGSRFDIYFPLEKKADLKKGKKVRELTVQTGEGHILFVDDDAQICDSQKKALEPLGYTLTAIQDSRVAEEIFTGNPAQFDALIVDLNMPHLNGFELTERLLAIRSDIPVVLTTGYTEMIDSKKIEKLGFHSLLLKPYKIADIARLLKEILTVGKTERP
ncbi:MAG: response regulator, partial [Candidatus Aminicenantes bacterium]|nr:response regulator [Candidatus Aminicenantes bacterium]